MKRPSRSSRAQIDLWVGALALAALASAFAVLPGAATSQSQMRKPHKTAAPSLPASFVPNVGQLPSNMRYSAQGAGYRFAFTTRQLVLSFAKQRKAATIALEFLGADPRLRLQPRAKLAGKASYFLGGDSSKWHVGLPTYGELLYRHVWSGIDALVRGEPGRLKYEFRVRPGADVHRIRLAYRGARAIALDHEGALSIATPLGTLTDAAPTSYQVIGGRRVPVTSSYVLGRDGRYGFALGGYDAHRPLVIDPGLDYSTFLGGSGGDGATGIAVDGGYAYVSGCTDSLDFPTTPGAVQPAFSGGFDAFVTKLAMDGSAVVYSTYLGGSDFACIDGIAAEGGHAYVIGSAGADFPTTPGAYQRTYAGGEDAFVAELSQDGSSLVYATYLGGGGDEEGHGIAVHGGRVFVTGNGQAGFPTTARAFQRINGGAVDVFVTELAKDGSALAYSTFLGGSGDEEGKGVALQGGNAYITGFTRSTNFPTTPGAFQRTFGGGAGGDAFVTQLNKAGSALVYSTYLGGSSLDGGNGVAVEGGRAYIAGGTSSTDFPTTSGAFMPAYGGGLEDGFVTEIDKTGSALAYSTYVGGSSSSPGDSFPGDDEANAVSVAGGRAYIVGTTNSLDFPTTAGAFQPTLASDFDAFTATLASDGSRLTYSTYLGGSAFDKASAVALGSGRTYVAGQTNSSDFPTTAGAAQPTNHGGEADAFVTKLATK